MWGFLQQRCAQFQHENNLRDILRQMKVQSLKTTKFCEISFKNGNLSMHLTAPCQCALRFFRPISLKYCPCHEARSYEVLHLSRKIMLTNLTIWCSEMQPSQEICPLPSDHVWLRCLLYCACHMTCTFAHPLQYGPHACHRFWNCKIHTCDSLLTRCRIHCSCRIKRYLNVQKWSEHVVC